MVQPNGGTITLKRIAAREHTVCTAFDIQVRTEPMDAILTDGMAHTIEPPCVVPHLEQAVRGIVKHAVAKRAGNGTVAVVHLQGSLWLKDRAGRMNLGLVERAPESGVGNQVVIHEQLSSCVDRNRTCRTSGLAPRWAQKGRPGKTPQESPSVSMHRASPSGLVEGRSLDVPPGFGA